MALFEEMESTVNELTAAHAAQLAAVREEAAQKDRALQAIFDAASPRATDGGAPRPTPTSRMPAETPASNITTP